MRQTVKKLQDDGTTTTVLDSKPLRSADEFVVLEAPRPATLVGDATTRNRPWPADVPKPEVKTYQVVEVPKSGTVRDRLSQQRTRLFVGKEIDDLNYDIRDLQRQGVKVKLIEKGDAPLEEQAR